MLVGEYMSTPAISTQGNVLLQNALRLMHERKFQRLPIVDQNGKLVGVVSERDLIYAMPVSITALGIWEPSAATEQIFVSDLMTSEVIVVTPDALLEEAARLMLKYRIGGLPVVNKQNEVVGVITESDILRAYLNRYKSREEMDVFIAGKKAG